MALEEVTSQSDLAAIDENIRDQSAAAPQGSMTDVESGSRAAATPAKKTAPTKLYVGNLSPKVTKHDLRDAFVKFGEVADVDVVGTFAFVVMPNESQAEDAIKALHDQDIDGKRLIVEKKKVRPAARRDRSRGPGARDIQLFVAKCKDIPEEKLKEIFEKFGDVNSIQKPRTKPDLAFVSMANFFEARKAIDSLNKKPIEGVPRGIFVQLSTNNTTRDGRPLQMLLERGETIKLFVGNLDKEKTDVKSLGELFERYGPVFDVAIIKDKGFGFVHMLSRESAEDAVRGLNRREFQGVNISVVFSVKKGMTINKPPPGGMGDRMGAHMGALMGAHMGGRLGARTMMPRVGMNRGRDVSPPMRPHGDVFGDRMMDPLFALQQQINTQYLSPRSGYGELSARSPFNFDALFPRELVSYPYPTGASRSPTRLDPGVRFNGEDRSRYAGFVNGSGTSPLKRGRSPMRGVQRLSPSPKRNLLDNRFSPPRMGSSMGESSVRRNPAKSMPPKMMRPGIF